MQLKFKLEGVKILRSKLSVSLVLLLVTFPTFASFSMFLSISPANENNNQDIRPTIKSKGDSVAVSIPYIEGERKYWLIVSDKMLPTHKQNFRDVIWSGNIVHPGIILIAPLGYPFQEHPDQLVSKDKPEIQIVLPRTLAMHSYIYYDYPKSIYDGGFYYTIDIPSYLQKHVSR